MKDSFHARTELRSGGRTYRIASLRALSRAGMALERLPYSMRILLENLLRREDGETVTAGDVRAVAEWQPRDPARTEIAFMPARVLLQDFTGVPAVVDLAAMRDAMAKLGGDPRKINPLQPAELVIDHSVQVDAFGSPQARGINAEKEYERNRERYAFLRWGQEAFENFRVVPPDTGIVHQVNLEYLARVVMGVEPAADGWAYPDTLVGTDSHTTMINGLGVLGWGVGGIEAEAAMLGQPISMLIPDVVGFRLTGRLREGVTATDLVLAVTQRLRRHGVVGKFVEFTGNGLSHLSLADRATIANMAPEYGATCGIFPVDEESLRYLELSGREPEQVQLARDYLEEQGLFHTQSTPEAEYSELLELDLGAVVPSLAGPRRPQDRLALSEVKESFEREYAERIERSPVNGGIPVCFGGAEGRVRHGSVVIAAITSCTNTSNPSVMLAAGLVAKKAADLGLFVDPWVKTSLAPGSKVVTRYLQEAGLLEALERQRFHLVGYGCTTCIGNSGPLPPPVDEAIGERDLVVASVLSGNRNFEGRVHPAVRASYLASPPLVVAYALAGRVDFDPEAEPLGIGAGGREVFLRDVWPSQEEVNEAVARTLRREMFEAEYADVFTGDEAWRSMATPEGDTYAWDERSTYVQRPPYFDGMGKEPEPVTDVAGARCLALLGDSITTDHISPAGSIKPTSPAGLYLQSLGVPPAEFNSYGARRGNHEVMMRGTFANVRLKNRLVPGVEGGETVHLPDGERMSIYDAAMRYREERVPLVVIAGAEYGTGSSRDWAAKGAMLLGVRAVVAQSFERIHRSNLIGMGILPLELEPGATAESLGLTGRELFDVRGLAELVARPWRPGWTLSVVARGEDGERRELSVRLRVDTPQEAKYLQNGGILQYVLRKLV